MPSRADPDNASSMVDLSAALRGSIAPVRSSPLYVLGLAMVTGVIILLPLIYMGIVALVGYAVYWHATTNYTVFESAKGSGAIKFAFIAYIVPIIGGGIGVIFLLKPLFAPRARAVEGVVVSRADEPRLHAYVELLCNLMGAPVPRRIDVTCEANASASLAPGLLSLVGNRVVLTIGLPLVAGLSLKGLTSVLAHEFGHFTQGWAMRLGYITWRIQQWFSRVAYERDGWDEQLAEWQRSSESWIAGLIVLVATIFIWLSRVILKGLLFVSAVVSSFMSRRQEFDADTWSARVVGSQATIATLERIPEFGASEGAALRQVGERLGSQTVPDNLVALIDSLQRSMPADVRRQLAESLQKARAGWFDSHPSTPDRVEFVRSLDDPGIFHGEGPATSVFGNFDELCRLASYQMYKRNLGERVMQLTFVPTARIVERIDADRSKARAASDYLGGLIHPLFPIEISVAEASEAPASPRDAVAELRACRASLDMVIVRLAPALNDAAEASDRLHELAALRDVKKAKLVAAPARFKIESADSSTIDAQVLKAQARDAQARETIEPAARLMARRLTLALSILRHPKAAEKLPDVERRLARIDVILMSYDSIVQSLRDLWPCGAACMTAGAIIQSIRGEQDHAPAQRGIEPLAKDITRRLRDARNKLVGLSFQSGEDESFDIAQRVVPVIPPTGDFAGLFAKSSQAVDELAGIYQKALAELCEHAAAAEKALGLRPLIEPTA